MILILWITLTCVMKKPGKLPRWLPPYPKSGLSFWHFSEILQKTRQEVKKVLLSMAATLAPLFAPGRI